MSCYFSGACWAMSRTSAAGRITGSSPSPSLPPTIENMPGLPACTDRIVSSPTTLPEVVNAGVPRRPTCAGLDHVERARLSMIAPIV